MAHIAFLSLSESGHINPTLPIVRELADRGHRVTYAADAKTAERVRQAGAEPIRYDARPAETIVVDSMDAAARHSRHAQGPGVRAAADRSRLRG